MAIEFITIKDAHDVSRNVATDLDGTNYYQVNKVAFGADGTFTLVTAAVGLPVNVLNTTLAATQSGTWNVGTVTSITNTVAVSAASLPLPTGAATAANQTTLIGHVDGLEGLLTTIDADTSSLAGCVAGTELQVDVVSSALPTGAATAAKQPALGTAGTASTDVLTVQGIVSMTALKVDGSAVTQPVSAASLPLPTGAATSANQTTLIGHVDGIEGLLTTIDADTGALAACASGSELQVDIVSSALPSGAATAANQTTVIGHLDGVEGLLGTIDADTGALAGCVAGTELQVDVLTMPSVAVTNAGTFAVQAAQSGTWNVGTVTTVTTVATVTTITNAVTVAGGAAHDAAVSGNPLLIGVEARRARATAVSADGDAVRLQADRYGRLKTTGIDLSIAALDASSSGDTALIAAPGASTRIKLIRVEASNTHASTALTVGLKSASLNGGTIFGKKYLPAAGGQAVWVFPNGHLMAGANEALNANLSAAGTVSFTAYYETVAD
jgi:hypothetical protein